MFANKYYERDIENAFAMHRFFFRMLGLWPFAHVNSLLPEQLETVVVVSVCFACFILETIPILLFIFMVLKDVRVKLKVMGSAMLTIVEIMKYGYVLFYKSQMRDCLILIDEDWRNVVNPSDRMSMIEKVKIGKRLVVICAVMVYTVNMIVRVVIPLSAGKIVTPQNITIRPLPAVAYLVIFDVQRSPVYEIIYFIQTLAGFFKFTIIVATFGFVTLCAMHFCSQSNILITLMNDFVNESRPKNLNKKLSIVVEHQIRIKNFLQMVQSVTQYPSLIEVLGSTVMLCFIGYYIITEWEDQNILRLFAYSLVLIMFVFNVFIYCYMGEQIIEHVRIESLFTIRDSIVAGQVALTACTLEWYRLPDIQARAVILLIIVSETPFKLKAGSFIDLSLRTFGNITKMAVTYFNILLSLL